MSFTIKESATNATNAKCHDVNMALDIDTAPEVPEIVYDCLPDILKTRCSLIDEKHRRDIFLVAALPVLAAHMPNVLTGHIDGSITPDFYTLIVAGPAQGKGTAGKAKNLGSALNRHFIEKSEAAKELYEADEIEELPRTKSLFVPANSSSRAVYDSLDANGGSGLIFESEIDTLLNATSQEWGNFSDITRKAFHHESLSINRKGELFYIENPRLSICLTGTFDQFKKMFESAENGHFSRYALFTFNPPLKWISQRPTNRSVSLNESIQTASQALRDMYLELETRTTPLWIDLNDEQRDMIDNTFEQKMDIIEQLDLSQYLHASNRRAAMITLRIACILTVLRNGNRLQAEALTPSMDDMTAALWLGDTFIKHAIRLYHILPKSEKDSKGKRYEEFKTLLPREFETADALVIGEELEIPERTIKRWLNSEDYNRIKRGVYAKI